MTTSSVLNPSTPPAAVLMNKGVPVKVYKVEQTGTDVWEAVLNEDSGEPQFEYEWRHIRLNALALSEIEDRFGSINGWEVALTLKPFRVVVETMSIVWEIPVGQAGKMMIETGLDGYTTALGASFVIANGGEVDAVVRVLQAGIKAGTQARKDVTAATMKLADRSDRQTEARAKAADSSTSPGPTGSPNGAEPVVASTSSGG